MLKTKAGEVVALENLQPATKDRVLPILHITTSVSPRFAPGMGAAWTNRPLAVDGSFSFNTSASTAPYSALIRALRQNGVSAYPCIASDADPRLVAAAAALVGAEGVAVKTSLLNLPQVAAWIQGQGWMPANVDLIVSVGHVAGMPTAMLAQLVSTALLQNVGANSPYRSLTLAAASAPKDHGDLPRGRSDVLRSDWELWQATAPNVPFQLDYGDYGTGHPDLTEPPGVAMASATVSARYTGHTHWLVVKGRSTRGAHGLPMPQQYLSHANHYLADPQFGNLPGCWADDRIAQISVGAIRPGNRQTWSEIAANRHIEIVVSQLP